MKHKQEKNAHSHEHYCVPASGLFVVDIDQSQPFVTGAANAYGNLSRLSRMSREDGTAWGIYLSALPHSFYRSHAN